MRNFNKMNLILFINNNENEMEIFNAENFSSEELFRFYDNNDYEKYYISSSTISKKGYDVGISGIEPISKDEFLEPFSMV